MNPYVAALLGGAVIGLSASALLWLEGRVAGVSGIAAGLFFPVRAELGWRGAFLAGLVAGGFFLRAFYPHTLGAPVLTSPALVIGSGLLVGFGTQLGGGCTSGHGVCGLASGSGRSLMAVVTFMLAGAATVFLAKQVLGGAP